MGGASDSKSLVTPVITVVTVGGVAADPVWPLFSAPVELRLGFDAEAEIDLWTATWLLSPDFEVFPVVAWVLEGDKLAVPLLFPATEADADTADPEGKTVRNDNEDPERLASLSICQKKMLMS